MSLGDLELNDHLDIFPLVNTEVINNRDEFNNQSHSFTGPWDDSVVHGVNGAH